MMVNSSLHCYPQLSPTTSQNLLVCLWHISTESKYIQSSKLAHKVTSRAMRQFKPQWWTYFNVFLKQDKSRPRLVTWLRPREDRQQEARAKSSHFKELILEKRIIAPWQKISGKSRLSQWTMADKGASSGVRALMLLFILFHWIAFLFYPILQSCCFSCSVLFFSLLCCFSTIPCCFFFILFLLYSIALLLYFFMPLFWSFLFSSVLLRTLIYSVPFVSRRIVLIVRVLPLYPCNILLFCQF